MSKVDDAGEAVGTLEDFARLTALLAHRFNDRARILSEHRVDEAQLERARRAWRERLRDHDAEELRERFYTAFDEAMSSCTSPPHGSRLPPFREEVATVRHGALPQSEAFEPAPPPGELPSYLKASTPPPEELDDTLPIPLSRQGMSAAPLPFVTVPEGTAPSPRRSNPDAAHPYRSGETWGLDDVVPVAPRALPFARDDDDSLTIEQFAFAQAELTLWPDHAAQILAKYGLDDEAKRRSVNRTWERRVSTDLGTRARYAELVREFRSSLIQRKAGGQGPP